MNWDAMGAIGEVLGAVGVMITLAYLAVQIRQNTRSQRTETYGRALDRVTTLQGRLSESSELADILLRGVPSSQALSAQERVRFAWVFYEMFSGFEFIYDQAQSGALPEEVWQRWADTLRWWISFPGVLDWWEGRPTPFSRNFTNFVDAQRSASVPDAAAQARWIRYLTQREHL